MFSLRIVNVDSYQSAPTKGYDICYSEFRGCEVYKVPIIRIFGITPAGQKGCLHVHGVFPYFSIRCKDVFPNIEAKSLRKYMQELAMDIDKALNVASRNSNSHRQHVYKIVITEHIPFYGFHEKAEEFLKIYFYNPFDISRTAELMTNGVILNKFIQPYEAHIPYILQFFIDYNLFGMNLINVSKFKFRAAEDDLVSPISPLRNQSLSHILDESNNALNKVWNIGTLSSSQISSLPRQTVCELEADCCSSEIMNRLSESFSSGKNPGLLAIWEEEKQRRKAENDTSMITPVPSQERADFIETESENFYKKKLRKILESFDGFKVIQKEKNDHTMKDLDMPSNSLDLSTSQDEDLLNMMLSMVNSQSTQLDDDSVLGLDHQNDMQSDSIEDETREMSQLFTGELEELWSSQITSDDSSRHRTDANSSTNTVIEHSVISDENAIIPQLDGAFDDQDFNPKNKQTKKSEKKPMRDISEESLIKSCNLLQPVVQLTQSVIIKTEVLSPAVSRPESDTYSDGLLRYLFMDEDSSLSCNTPKGNSFPICVPVSRNARCSLIMNIYENSNDVSIEHTCSTRNNAELDSFADAEDPANVVFEILTNLVYKVECITEGKTSCYEHLIEEYQGKSCSDILYQGLSTEEKNTISQIKATPSDFEEKPIVVKKDHFNEQHLSLPIKKRIFRNDQCDSCSHSVAMDFSKIGKEVVLLRKLSESDFMNHVNLNSLKVVIPPLPLHSVSSLTGSVRIDDSFDAKSKAPAKKDSSISLKKILESKDTNNDINNYSSTVEIKKSSEVEMKKSSEVEMKKSSEVEMKKSSEVEMKKSSEVEMKKSSEVEMKKSSEVEMKKSSEVEMKKSSEVEMKKSSEVEMKKSSEVEMKKSSEVEMKKSSEVEMKKSSEVEKKKSSEVEIKKSSEVEIKKSSEVKIKKSSEVKIKKSKSSEVKIKKSSDVKIKKSSDVKIKKSSAVEIKKNSEVEIKKSIEVENNNSVCTPSVIDQTSLISSAKDTDLNSKQSYKCENNNTSVTCGTDNSDISITCDTDNYDSSKNSNNKISCNTEYTMHDDYKIEATTLKDYDSKLPLNPVVEFSSSNTDHETRADNMDHTVDTNIIECIDADGANHKNSNDCTDIKIDAPDSQPKIVIDNINDETVNSPDSETKKVDDKASGDERKCATMSELRLYRRKKSSFGRGSLRQDVAGGNNKFLSSSTRLTRDSTSKCMPVVQLEPCKDLIDRYCKSESPDSDCLILGEISHEPKIPPVMKEKRFFRSRARHLRGQNLSSNVIINHKLGLNGSKFKKNRFAPCKKGKQNISGPSTNRPNLRKRTANFDSPDKKKLPHPHSNYVSEKNALDKKLEQVYDFESHLNADDYEQLDRSFSTYSLVNKSFTSTLKRSVSGKLSLKLNRKRFIRTPIDPVPVYDVTDNSDLLDKQPTRTRPTRRASASVICYNEDHFQTQKDNQFLTKRLKRNPSENVITEEIVIPNDKSEVTNNEDNFNWCIDDIPISQLKDVHSLKCTISKKRINYENNLHEVERLPIPKFKVRKKSSSNPLNVSIKFKKSSFGFINNDADFKIKEKVSEHSTNRKSHKKNSKSRKKSQALTSALDVKHKYKKCKEAKKESLKTAIWQYCSSPSKNKITISTSLPSTKNDFPEVGHWKKKLNFCKPNSPSLSSYNSNSTARDEISSDVSNLSPFTEDNSDDSKRSKSSLKMKLKLKRILTRSNEERIVVVGKELEGIETDSDANETKQISGEDHASNQSIINKEKSCKKALGTKLVNNQGGDCKLKSKFKSPLMVENKKVEKPVIEIQKCLTEDNKVIENSKIEENNKFKEKIPKFKYKPLLANISKDLLSETVDNSATTGVQISVSPKSEPNFIISPKKKSPLKSAELIKKELAYLNEMISTTNNYTNFDTDLKSSDRVMTDLKYAEIPNNCKMTKDSCDEEVADIIADDIHLSPTHSRLRERKHSTGCKIPSRRNSLRMQDFKMYFDSDNDDNTLNSAEKISSGVKCPEKLNIIPDLYSICKPCTVQLRKLSSFEIEKYMHKHLFTVHNSENLTVFDPLVASFPSPVVDSKSADSYIDPKKIFENLFEFSSPSQSPINYNPFEASNLVIGNDISVGPFSNENSEHSRKESFKLTANLPNPLKPSDVFKSVERNDMGVLWNLSYFSPPQLNIPEKFPFIQRKNLHIFDQKENSVELDDLQKLASRVNQLCSKSYNLLESESENSTSLLNEKNTKYNCNNKETKISFENILEGNTMKSFHNETEPSFSQTPTEFEVRHINDKSEHFEFNCSEEITKVIKEEPKSDQDHVFEPTESLPNVRILDFQECLVESDSEMNPLLNDSEIDSVISSADMILSNSVDKNNFEQCMQTELPLDDPSLDMQDELKCASEEPKSDQINEELTKVNIDSSLQKELDADLTCNNAIITAADTSSLLIPSYKNNTIPVLAINNPNQDGSVSFTAFEEQNFSTNGQFFPVMLAPVSVTDNENYLENSSTTMKETTPGAQECVNFLEDNELLQSCSVSSTSDIENKSTQASNALGIPFNGEEDILSMIVKSCDIGEEFDVNMNSVEENEGESISSATLCNVDSNYVMSGSNFIISSQPDQNTFPNSENAVSSSSENNLIPKNTEIVVIKTEPIDVPNMEQIVYEIQDKSHAVNHVSKNIKSGELGNEENVLLDSMIHSFYGDDSLYGLHSSANSDNLSLLCPAFQNSNSFSHDTEKFTECNPASLTASVVKTADVSLEDSSSKSDSYFKNISIPQAKLLSENDSVQYKNAINDKVPLGLLQNSLVPHSKISSKRFYFTPSSKPPSRDLIEASEINSEHGQNMKLSSLTEEDSLGSDHSLGSPISTNDVALPNVFNKALINDTECVGSQNFHSVPKNIPHHDGKAVIQSPIIFHEKDIANFSFVNNLISTPSTSNIKKEFPLPDIVVSPINKDPELIADTNKRKRRLVFEDDQTGSQQKMFKPGRENTVTLYNKFSRNNSVNQSGDSLGNLSFSQLDGPTLENSRGFKVGSDNYANARVRHEVQHLTIMSLENHVSTRNDLRPDPKFDPVTAIFYCIYNDTGINEEEEIVGMIVVDPLSHHQSSGQNSSEILKNYLLLCPGVKNGFIYCVDNEISLFEKLVSVIKEWDPDILVGYEIQMSSWGYLVERADVLNINLRLLLSRLVDKNETKILPIEHDPTITDQTADLSRLNIIGRIVLCVWRLMRKEVTLNVYTFENVYYHVLHKRTPLYAYHDLTNWFLGSQKEKVIRYFVIRVQGCIHLLEKLDVIGRTSELARLFGIQFYEVLSRGSQFRVESMMLRTAAPMSYIPVSPSVRQRSHSRAPECVPLILEPESRFYIDPVVVLDFQSLYPSMIIAYNYCFSTCLGRVEHFGKNVPFEFGCTSLNVPTTLLQKLQNDIHISPTGIAFAKSSVRRGILPSMLEEILNTRIMVKQSMKKIKEKNALKRLLDARQMGLKLIANVTYGYTGASFSGRMPSVEVADSIVGKGRETLERAIHMIENTSKWRAKVVYGDTDSLFILLPGRSKKQAFEIGQEIADAVTADNPKPVKLKFEKVYLPCVLQTKKRYVGFMYETVDQENPVFDAKGIETVRRDSCPATAKILEKSLKILFKSYDVTLVKNYVQKQFTKLLSGRVSIIDYVFAKEYRGISGYRPGACVPALEIAKKRLAKDPRSEPRVGERVPYVVVYGFPGVPIIQLVREPIELLRDLNLRINSSYYITRVISPPLERVFNLLGADVKSWYTNLARTFKPTLPMTRPTNQHRGTLSQYFVTLSCPSCEKPTFSTVCDDCREDLQGTTITLNEKIRQWERTVDHLTQICGSCTKSGSSIDCCVSLDCPMLFKLNAAKKDLSQAPYLRKVLAHELF